MPKMWVSSAADEVTDRRLDRVPLEPRLGVRIGEALGIGDAPASARRLGSTLGLLLGSLTPWPPDDRPVVSELELTRIKRYVDARVPSRLAAQIRMEVVGARPSPSSRRGRHGVRTSVLTGRASRSLSFGSSRPSLVGRCTGATATYAGTATIGSPRPPTSTPCSRRSKQIRRRSSGVDGRRALTSRTRRVRVNLANHKVRLSVFQASAGRRATMPSRGRPGRRPSRASPTRSFGFAEGE